MNEKKYNKTCTFTLENFRNTLITTPLLKAMNQTCKPVVVGSMMEINID